MAKKASHGLAARLFRHPVVQKALADLAVAAIVAIVARIEGSKPVRRAEARAGEDIGNAAKSAADALRPQKKARRAPRSRRAGPARSS